MLLPTSLVHVDRAFLQADCSFNLGFQALHDQLPSTVGDCVENEHFDATTGNAEQQTTGGLLVWRQADNWTAFTDGKTTWINGPGGVVSRGNAGPLFSWEADIPTGDLGDADPPSLPAYAEIRPENTPGNQRVVQIVPWQWKATTGLEDYYRRLTADYHGTTEQILEWAAQKWGFDEVGYGDLAKAMAVKESRWQQSKRGDFHPPTYYYSPVPSPGYPTDFQSYGILQVKRTVWPGSYPNSAESTAFNADYAMAVVRMAYDGRSWQGDRIKGNVWAAVAFWFSSSNPDPNGEYATAVRQYFESKPWQKPGF